MTARPARTALLIEMPPELKHDLAGVAWRQRTSMAALLRQAAADLIRQDKTAQQPSQQKTQAA